jgi:hypothetical protein
MAIRTNGAAAINLMTLKRLLPFWAENADAWQQPGSGAVAMNVTA